MMNESVGGPPHPVKPHTTVTVTTDSGPAPQALEIRLNIGYFKTIPGIIKLVELVLGVVCMACASPASRFLGRTAPYINKLIGDVGSNHWFLFVVVTTFILTLLWSFFYLLQLRDSIKIKLPFTLMKVEVIFTMVATLMYFVGFIVILAGYGYCAGATHCDARIAGGVFGIFNTLAYGLGAYILYGEYSNTPPELQ